MEHGELIKLVQRESIFQEQSRSLYLGHAKKKWMRKLTFLQGEGVELVGVRRSPPKKKTEKNQEEEEAEAATMENSEQREGQRQRDKGF